MVDLRGNGGGLRTPWWTCWTFLDEGQTMVYTEGKSSPQELHLASTRALCGLAWVVLVDEGSAWPARNFRGAAGQRPRLGRGPPNVREGLVQEEFPVPGSGALRLTVARFYA